jgi:two-component system OmpR family response regulator
MRSLLLLEDDDDLRDELTDFLSRRGYAVRGAETIDQAEQMLAQTFDLLVLDINLPDGSGLDLCQRMRSYIRSGIVMLTGRSERELRIQSLKGGADAYLVKPVDPEELDATLQSVLRRVNMAVPSLVQQVALPVQWRLDQKRQTLIGPNGKPCKLSTAEDLLLNCLLRNPSQEVTRIDLLAVFDAAGFPSNGRNLEALVSRLRRKVFEHIGLQLPIVPVYSKGYVFTDHAVTIPG